MPIKKIHLGKMLLEKNLITQSQLDQAIAQQQITGQRLGHVLVDLNFIAEEKLLEFLADQLKVPYVNLKDYALKAELVARLPEFYARQYRAIVLKQEEDGSYLVGMADPQDLVASDEISRLLKTNMQNALVREEDLLNVIDLMYRRTSDISSFAEEL